MPVAIQIVGDPASYVGALGASMRTTAEFRDMYMAAFSDMSDATLGLAVSQGKLAAASTRYESGTLGAAAATLQYRKSIESMHASQLAAVSSIGKGLTMGVTAPVAALGYEATKMALSFDQAMELIHTQAGASTAEVSRMSGAVLDLVKSGHSYTQSANSMAQGLFYIESEGIRGSKALDILRVAAAGAAVGQASLQDTTNALTSAIHVFGTTSTGAAGVMATLNAAVGQGKLHMEDLNAALGTKLLVQAKALGLTLPQLLAGIDQFTKSGVPASSAATSIAMALMRMADPTTAGQKALASLGIGASQLANELKSGGLPEALGTVAKQYEALVKAGETTTANADIFNAFGGSRGGAAALTMVQQYANYMKTLGAIQQQSSPATFWSDVASAMNQPDAKIHESLVRMSADLIEIGQKIAPLVADVTTGFADIVGAINSLPEPAKKALEIFAVGFGAAGPLLWGGAKAIKMFQELKTAVSAIGTAAQWAAGKFTAGAATTDTAMLSEQAAAAKTAASVDAIGTQLTVVGTDAVATEAKFETQMVAMQGEADATATSVRGIGTAALGILGPLTLVATALYEIDQHQKTLDRAANWVSKNVFGQAGSASGVTVAQIAAAIVKGDFSQKDLNELKAFGLKASVYTAAEKDLQASMLGPEKPTAAQARSNVSASLSGKGTLVLADVLSAISMGLVTSTWLSANRDRFANSSDYEAAVRLVAVSTLAGTQPLTGGSVAGPSAVTPLTLQQQYALNPNDPAVLAALAAQDKTRLAELSKKRAEGLISNTAYVAAASPLEAQVQAYDATIKTATDKTQTAKDKAAAAAKKAQSTYATSVSTRAKQLQDALAGNTGQSGQPLTSAHVQAYDALVAFYKSEEQDSKLTAAERAKYAGDATAARQKELTEADRAAATYENTVIAGLKALADRAKIAKTNIAGQETALRNLAHGYAEEAANKNLTPEQRATARQHEATTLGQVQALRDTYTTPARLSLAAAKAQAQAPGLGTETDMAELASDRQIRAAAEKALKSGGLAIQGQIQAWNTIADMNQQIEQALGTGIVGQILKPSAEKLTAGIKGLSTAARKVLEMRIAQEQGHSGVLANYTGLQGVAASGGALSTHPVIHTHTTVKLDGRVLTKVVSTHQTKKQRYRAVQTRGINAGR